MCIRDRFNRYPTYVGSSPYESVAMLAIIPYIEIAMGGWYVPGGLYKIIENLEKILTNLGVNIIKNTEISNSFLSKFFIRCSSWLSVPPWPIEPIAKSIFFTLPYYLKQRQWQGLQLAESQ